ncbi:MAG TPA: SLC13 family permease [Vicinamibacterales bacterium]|jgi:Na+/H+ antiporter NhaD/arsenite permease-like protein|nr:SLC13 family permease [Vicinamibacterales bacterium]
MNLAVLSVCALGLAIIVSCVSRLNVGVLAVALAWVVGVYAGGLPVNTVMSGFPSQLFLTLVGVTLLFAMAQANGTLERLTHHAVRICRGNRGVIPIMFFVLSAVLASIGPGNIATAALVVPIAMATASRTKIPSFLMAIMAGNGANAGSLSPFAPTGIIVSGLMARNGLPGFEWQTYRYNLLAHATVAFVGYAIFGGLKLFRDHRVVSATDEAAAASDPAEGPFESRHWWTLAVIAALIASVLFAQVNVGMGAFAGAVILVITGAADDAEAIKRMPWRVIVMVCGVTVLIALVERVQGIDLLVSLVARVATPHTVTAVVAFFTGLVSVYSSTSGVVLPAFLPMVPGLTAQLPGASALAIASSMNIGGHLVDMSPLSTLGAFCIAGATAEDSRPLFNKLLAWGLSMAIVGAVLCFVLF